MCQAEKCPTHGTDVLTVDRVPTCGVDMLTPDRVPTRGTDVLAEDRVSRQHAADGLAAWGLHTARYYDVVVLFFNVTLR